MNLTSIWPYITLSIGFAIGFVATRGQARNSLLSVEIKHKEAETKEILVKTAQAIAKTEEGGSVKIRSKNEQAILADEERNRIKELMSEE